MVRLSLVFLLAIIALAAPATARTPQGWKVRVDLSQSASDPDDVSDVKMVTMGKGFRVTGGPAGTFWNPAHTAAGNFTARATFTLLKPSGHTNYYGVIFGGADLEGAGQRYVYFLLAQNGTFTIRTRRGESVQDVQPRTSHAAIRQPGADGRSTNTLEVRVAGGATSYVVNGVVVRSARNAAAGVTSDGIVGVRVNHLLDVQVEGFEVQRQ